MATRQVQPKDVLQDGRYDFTLLKRGETREGDSALHLVIDSGPFSGKQITARLRPPVADGGRFSAHVRVERFPTRRGVAHRYVLSDPQDAQRPPEWTKRTASHFQRVPSWNSSAHS